MEPTGYLGDYAGVTLTDQNRKFLSAGTGHPIPDQSEGICGRRGELEALMDELRDGILRIGAHRECLADEPIEVVPFAF